MNKIQIAELPDGSLMIMHPDIEPHFIRVHNGKFLLYSFKDLTAPLDPELRKAVVLEIRAAMIRRKIQESAQREIERPMLPDTGAYGSASLAPGKPYGAPPGEFWKSPYGGISRLDPIGGARLSAVGPAAWWNAASLSVGMNPNPEPNRHYRQKRCRCNKRN